MTLSLHATWTAEAEQSRCRPRFLVTIWVASATSVKMLSGRSSVLTYPVSVLSVTQMTRAMDLWTRRVDSGTIDVVLRNDQLVNAMIVAYGLRNTRIEITLGFEDTDEANYAPYFAGVIDNVLPGPLGTEIRTRNADNLLERTVRGSWLNKHPLEIVSSVLTDASPTGVAIPAAFVDSTSLDPTTYASASPAFSHWVADCGGTDLDGDRGVMEATPAREVIDSLIAAMSGSLFVSEAGLLTFSAFDSTAAADDAWTSRDLIGDPPVVVDDLYSDVVNRIIVEAAIVQAKYGGHWGVRGIGQGRVIDATMSRERKIRWQEDDSSSQARFAYCNASSATDTINEQVLSLPWAGGVARTRFDDTAVGGTFDIVGQRPYSFCGSRFTSFPAGLQPAWASLSTSRTSYIMISDRENSHEIVECDQVTFHTGTDKRDTFLVSTYYPSTMLPVRVYRQPHTLTLRVKTRGCLGTSSAAHGTAFKPAVDITMPVALARAKLARHANGVQILKCRTNLSKYNLQIGDFVTLTIGSDVYRSWGRSGLTTAVKWEIIGKNVDLFSDVPGILWTLAFAAESSPPATTYAQTPEWSDAARRLADRNRDAVRESDVSDVTIISGFDYSVVSGLQIKVSAGVASSLTIRGVLEEDHTETIVASKDTWISFDCESSSLLFRTRDLSSTQPTLGQTETLLYKIVAGAASVSSYVDYRTIQQGLKQGTLNQDTVSAAKLFTAADYASLLPNGEFTAWSPPFDDKTENLPDKWELCSSGGTTPLWASSLGGADRRVYYNTSESVVGDNSVEVEHTATCNTAYTAGVRTVDFLPVVTNQLYLIEAAIKFDSSTDTAADLTCTVLQKDKATTAASIGSGSAAAGSGPGWHYPRLYVRPGADAAYLRIDIVGKRRSPASSSGKAYFDYARCCRSTDAFRAYRASSNISIASGGATLTWSHATCQTESYDLNSNYTSGSQYFTAPCDGIWVFTAQATFDGVPSGDEVGVCVTSGGAPGAGTILAQDVRGNAAGVARDMYVCMTTAPLQLSSGDVIRMYVGWADIGSAGGSLAVLYGTYTTYFAGFEKKEL